MSLLIQALLSPAMIFRGKVLFFISLALYVSIAVIVFGGFSYILVENQDAIRQAVMDYLLPESWHGISERLVNFFFESQTKIVLVSMMISGSIVLASLILFPIKEFCSAKFEQESAYDNGPKKEFPLWMQGLEECKLFALYVAAQSVIFGVGYYPYEWCSWVSNVLSIFFLCYFFGLDFISPTFQRHRIHYSSIIKLLTKYLPVTLLFGALFTVPVLLFGQWMLKQETKSLAEMAATLFMVNIVSMALAVPAGTHVASTLMPAAKTLRLPKTQSKVIAYSFMLCVLALGCSFHGLVAMSMHHKSQLLKCYYDIDFGSMELKMPSLLELARGEKQAELAFDLTIHNPTPFDLRIETSHLTIWQNKNLISRTKFAPLDVASGQTKRQRMQLAVHLNTRLISGFPDMLQGWSAQMEFELMPGIPFIVKVL